MRLITKEQRNQVREYTFNSLIQKGYTQETYKGITIFKAEKEGRFYLEIFIGNSTKNANKYYYRDEKRRNEVIEQYKAQFDRREAYKAELKANPVKSCAANASAAIKSELKKHYPAIKFSVTSENFAGGNSVRVSYDLGPDDKEVNNIISKYQYGHFNGMEDIYEYSNSSDDIPQAKYVSASQSISRELMYNLAMLMSSKFSFKDVPKLKTIDDFNTSFPERWGSAWSWENLIYQSLRKTNFNTQDVSKISLIDVFMDEADNGGFYFTYSVDGILYDTRVYTKNTEKVSLLHLV
jgi:hypothetical protein